jgi:hypothetical protein
VIVIKFLGERCRCLLNFANSLQVLTLSPKSQVKAESSFARSYLNLLSFGKENVIICVGSLFTQGLLNNFLLAMGEDLTYSDVLEKPLLTTS